MFAIAVSFVRLIVDIIYQCLYGTPYFYDPSADEQSCPRVAAAQPQQQQQQQTAAVREEDKEKKKNKSTEKLD